MKVQLRSESGLTPEGKVILLTLGFVLFRSLLATQSSYPFHQGWNEGHYSLVAQGFTVHPLIPRYGSNHVYNVPPLFSYTIWASMTALGETEFAARLPSILAAGALLPTTYVLGTTIFDDRATGLISTLLLVTMPYFQLYGGRAQTDMMMTALVAMSMLAIIKGYDAQDTANGWLAGGGVLFAAAFAVKQPALLLPVVILVYLVLRRQFDGEIHRRTGLLIGSSTVALLPLAAWLVLNYLGAPTAFVSNLEHELLHRTQPFANLPLLLAIAGMLGITPLVLGLAGLGVNAIEWPWRLDSDRPFGHPSILVVWLVVFTAFVVYRSPHGHQYYALALLPPMALLAGRGTETIRIELEKIGVPSTNILVVGIVVTSTMGGTVLLFELSGEFSAGEMGGEQLSSSSGEFLAKTVSEDSLVLVASGFRPQIQWYTRGAIDPRRVRGYTVGNLTENRLQQVDSETSGTVYVVSPAPAWAKLPLGHLERVHTTPAYQPAVIAPLNRLPLSGTKFGYYVADRQLVVYRVNETQWESNA